jgi:CubicO group peptidase (beta-lactamase class C family)
MIAKKKMFAAVVVFSLLVAGVCTSAWAGDGNSKYDFSKVEEAIQKWVDEGNYPGAAIRIVRKDQIIYEKCFNGYTPDTAPYIASAAKWLCAATMMTLVDEGRIGLDEPTSNFLPNFKGDLGTITLRQLLSHTSGIRYVDVSGEKMKKARNIAEYTEIIAAELTTLTHKPGTQWEYGGQNLIIAGRIAEILTGKSYEQVFQDNIAGPCRMKRTCEGLNLNFLNQGRNVYPNSSLNDYCNFLSMIAHDGEFEGRQVISARLIREMQADQVKTATMPEHQFVSDVRKAKHGCYGFGEWREFVNNTGAAEVVSSPSYAGFYPWIDHKYELYGVFVGYQKPGAKLPAMEASAGLVDLVREAISESEEQR